MLNDGCKWEWVSEEEKNKNFSQFGLQKKGICLFPLPNARLFVCLRRVESKIIIVTIML